MGVARTTWGPRFYSGPTAGYLRMIYAGGAVAAEPDSAGTLTLGYTWGFGADNLVAVHGYSDGGHWYVVPDQLHSVRGLRERAGPSVLSLRYRIYGAALDSAGTAPFALRYRWTGREYDAETGFYYFRARYYDPQSQRFVQEDPIGYAGGAVLYGYADGNPVIARDPSGLATENPGDFGGECMTGTLSACMETSDPLAAAGGGGGGGGGAGGGGWMDDVNSSLTYTDPSGLTPCCVAEVLTLSGTAAASDGPLPFGDVVAGGLLVGLGIVAVAEKVSDVYFAVRDKQHERVLGGLERNVERHFSWLAGNGPAGKDPNRWGKKWLKDIARGIEQMRERLGRIRSDADAANWVRRIHGLEERLQQAQRSVPSGGQ